MGIGGESSSCSIMTELAGIIFDEVCIVVFSFGEELDGIIMRPPDYLNGKYDAVFVRQYNISEYLNYDSKGDWFGCKKLSRPINFSDIRECIKLF